MVRVQVQVLSSTGMIEVAATAYLCSVRLEYRGPAGGTARALWSVVGRGVRRFTDLRAWQACCADKQAVYVTCAHGPLAHDWTLRRQIETSVAGPPAHLAEGFGRFSPAEFARFAAIARASLMESQNPTLPGGEVTNLNVNTNPEA